MKKFIAFVLSLCIVGGCAPTAVGYLGDNSITASAAEYTEGTYGDITYLQYEDHIEILKCDYGVSGAVGVPSKINDLPVTVIRSGAFLACQYITSIQIPSSVTTIGSSAFSQCTFLESAVMSDSVTSIGESAFFGCGKLTSVTLSSNLNAIPTSCFESCESLESITIPESVTSIGNLAFYGCYALTSVTIKNPNCSIYDSKGTFSDTAKEYFDEAAFHGTIYGYEGSTAQAHAEKYDINFIAISGTDLISELGKAYFIGVVGTEQNWKAGDNPNVNVVSINGDAQYECTWNVSEAISTGDSWFLAVLISPTGVEKFSTDEFPELTATIDRVWVDGVELTDFSTDGAIDTAWGYDIKKGYTRLYLHDNWAGTNTNIIKDCDINEQVKVWFTIAGTGYKGTSNTTEPDEQPPVTTTTTYVPPERNTATDERPLVTTTTTTTTTTTVPPVTTTTSNETPPVTTTNSATPGDINGDGEVTVADATYIMQWAAAPDEYPLSDTAKKNGDVTGGGDGVTTSDALVIQQYLSGAISALPVQQ